VTDPPEGQYDFPPAFSLDSELFLSPMSRFNVPPSKRVSCAEATVTFSTNEQLLLFALLFPSFPLPFSFFRFVLVPFLLALRGLLPFGQPLSFFCSMRADICSRPLLSRMFPPGSWVLLFSPLVVPPPPSPNLPSFYQTVDIPTIIPLNSVQILISLAFFYLFCIFMTWMHVMRVRRCLTILFVPYWPVSAPSLS